MFEMQLALLEHPLEQVSPEDQGEKSSFSV